jgi:hypothetical protein
MAVYDNPADESRAPELWKNSAQWLKVERLLYIHADLIKEMRTHLHELASGDPKDKDVEPWLGTVPDELEKLTGQWDRDIIAPTSGLSDLMYKSVGIRDARHSLQLGLSMWRLSWITFIFLPLTFTVGFFGMNVDTFSSNPPIKYRFITSFPILALVLVLWYAVKHTLSTQRQNPLRRGVYEALYHELATEHGTLWTRRGPRHGVVPVGWWNGVKWRLVTSWFGEEKMKPRGGDVATREFGVWSRTKQWLVRRWLCDLAVMPATLRSADDIEIKEFGALAELLAVATPVAIAELDPTAASRLQRSVPAQRLRSLSPKRTRAPSEGGSEGVMVEEKGGSEDERGGEAVTWRERERMRERLDVPFREA